MTALTSRLRFSNLIARSVRANELRQRFVTSGVCVMSENPYWNLPLSDPRPEPVVVDAWISPRDRPLRQRLALLLMRRSELAEKVTAEIHNIDGCLDRPRVSDFAPLVDEGWASKDGDYHRLTQRGIRVADEVIDAFARQLGIHHKIIGAGSRFHYSMRCTCGETFSHSRNEGRWQGAQIRMWSRHLAEIEQYRTKGIPYVPSDLRVLKLIHTMFAPPTQPEG